MNNYHYLINIDGDKRGISKLHPNTSTELRYRRFKIHFVFENNISNSSEAVFTYEFKNRTIPKK